MPDKEAVEQSTKYLHDFKELLYCFSVIGKLLLKMSLHLLLAIVNGVFFILSSFTNNHRVHMGTLLSKMHLAISDQIQCNFQEAVFVKLSKIMEAFDKML